MSASRIWLEHETGVLKPEQEETDETDETATADDDILEVAR